MLEHPCYNCGYLPDGCDGEYVAVCGRYQRFLENLQKATNKGKQIIDAEEANKALRLVSQLRGSC